MKVFLHFDDEGHEMMTNTVLEDAKEELVFWDQSELPPDAVVEEDLDSVVDHTEFRGINHFENLMMEIEEQLGSEGFVSLTGDDFSSIYQDSKIFLPK